MTAPTPSSAASTLREERAVLLKQQISTLHQQHEAARDQCGKDFGRLEEIRTELVEIEEADAVLDLERLRLEVEAETRTNRDKTAAAETAAAAADTEYEAACATLKLTVDAVPELWQRIASLRQQAAELQAKADTLEGLHLKRQRLASEVDRARAQNARRSETAAERLRAAEAEKSERACRREALRAEMMEIGDPPKSHAIARDLGNQLDKLRNEFAFLR